MALLTKIRLLLTLFVAGLVISGATAIPLVQEVDCLASLVSGHGWLGVWLRTVQIGLHQTARQNQFLLYGTDWLAFGHFVIAIAFFGAIRDPLKNEWVVKFGIIASFLVIPFALVMGGVRGIPIGWRLIDCTFGIAGLIALLPVQYWIGKLKSPTSQTSAPIH